MGTRIISGMAYIDIRALGVHAIDGVAHRGIDALVYQITDVVGYRLIGWVDALDNKLLRYGIGLLVG